MGWFEIFESVASAVVPQTMHAHCSIKKLQPLRRRAVVIEIYFICMILCLCSKSIHTSYHYRGDRAILFEEPGESAYLCSSVTPVAISIEHVHPDSIRDSIRTKISDSQVPKFSVHISLLTTFLRRFKIVWNYERSLSVTAHFMFASVRALHLPWWICTANLNFLWPSKLELQVRMGQTEGLTYWLIVWLQCIMRRPPSEGIRIINRMKQAISLT